MAHDRLSCASYSFLSSFFFLFFVPPARHADFNRVFYVRPSERDDGDGVKSFESGERESRGRSHSNGVFQFPFPIASAYISALRFASEGTTTIQELCARGRDRFLSRGEDHSVHRRHLIANLSHLALPHKLNDRLNGWPSRYAKERFFGYFAKYPVKDFDGPLRSSKIGRAHV